MKKIDDIKHYISVKGSFTKFAGPNCSAFPELSDLFLFQPSNNKSRPNRAIWVDGGGNYDCGRRVRVWEIPLPRPVTILPPAQEIAGAGFKERDL